MTYMFPLEYFSATTSLINHFEMSRIAAGVSSPINCRTLPRYSSFEGEMLGSNSRVGNRMNIHSSQGLTMRTMAIQPNSGCSLSGCMTQWRFPFLFSTRWDRSAFTRTLIARPCPGFAANGRLSCLTTWLRAPSAPKMYFVRIRYSWFERSSRIVAIMWSGSSMKDTRVVLKRVVNPFHVAWRTSTGSRSVCGRSTGVHGLAVS